MTRQSFSISKSLANVLGKHSLLSKGDNDELQLLMNNSSESDVEELMSLLQKCANYSENTAQENDAGINYSQYFSAVTDSTLFRPANPKLALMQVAKAYHLDEVAFTKAYKSR